MLLCLSCGKKYKKLKVNMCCGKFKIKTCCDNPIMDTKENREKYKEEVNKNG